MADREESYSYGKSHSGGMSKADKEQIAKDHEEHGRSMPHNDPDRD